MMKMRAERSKRAVPRESKTWLLLTAALSLASSFGCGDGGPDYSDGGWWVMPGVDASPGSVPSGGSKDSGAAPGPSGPAAD
ncbi:MAG TPA: hypothetical protein VJU61_21390, partial [Polyangiaceae bacterium]|nr:hypothetical protein [Polyangiaceae bacterium]